jgi:hypothetical protein
MKRLAMRLADTTRKPALLIIRGAGGVGGWGYKH